MNVHFAGFRLHLQHCAVVDTLEGEGPGVRHNVDALASQGPLQQLAYLRVLVGQQAGHHLHDGDVDAVGVVYGGEFDADGAAAEDDGPGGQVRLFQGLAAGDDDFFVDGQDGDGAGAGAGGDDDVFGGDEGVVGGDAEGVGVDEAGLAGDVLDAVLAEQVGDAAGHAVDDAAAAGDGLGVVDGEVVEADAEFLGAVEEADDFGVAEDGLGGDAAPVEADAAEGVAFDDDGGEAKLGGANGGDIAAGPRADDGELVVVGGNGQGLSSCWGSALRAGMIIPRAGLGGNDGGSKGLTTRRTRK